nr:MAG TPA: antigen S-antigen protein [Caudoviricetes sp.]
MNECIYVHRQTSFLYFIISFYLIFVNIYVII